MPQVFASSFATEIQHRIGKPVIAVARHHVAGFGHVDVVGMRHQLEEFARMRLLHQLATSRRAPAAPEW